MKIICKISVVIITYNQEHLITRAINSVLSQKEWIYELVICDDCSTDNTWNIICEAEKKNPDIVRCFRNPVNLGIFGNIENSWNKTQGNVISYCSGDDEVCRGYYQAVSQYIEKNNIDCENESFCIYCDWKSISVDGCEQIYYNDKILSGLSPLSLKLRNLIYNRSMCYSSTVLKQFYPVRKDIGIYADTLIDIQPQLFAKQHYYFPFVGSIYYTDIGICSKTKIRSRSESYIKALNELEKTLPLDSVDKKWIRYKKERLSYSISKSFKGFILTWIYFFSSYDRKYSDRIYECIKDFFRMILKR